MEKMPQQSIDKETVSTQTKGFTGVEADPSSKEECPGEALDLGEINGDDQFHEDQAQEPVFCHIFKDSLVEQEGEMVNPGLADAYP